MQENIREKVKIIINTTKIGVSKDFSVEEKQELFEHFERFGLKSHTCRNRLFRDGWHEWELDGVLGCIINYGKRSQELANFASEAETFTIDDPIDSICSFIQEFYDAIDRKMDFYKYMNDLGMSCGTTVSHFKNPSNLFAWEIFGIRRLL